MTKLEAEVEKTEKNEEEPKKQKMETFKKILLVVHSFTLILSFILFVCGIVTNLKHLAFHEAWHASYGMYNGSVLCITVGVIGIIISIVGLVGTAKENYCTLLVFCVTLGLVVCLEVSLAISLFTLASQNKLGDVVNDTMMSSLEHFNKSGYEGVTKAWNLVQTELTCCGVHGPSDWHLQKNAFSRPFLPDSCCAAVQLDSLCRIDNQTFGPYEQGCLQAFTHFLHNNAGIIGAVIAIVALLQIAVIAITSGLIKKTQKPASCLPFF